MRLHNLLDTLEYHKEWESILTPILTNDTINRMHCSGRTYSKYLFGKIMFYTFRNKLYLKDEIT